MKSDSEMTPRRAARLFKKLKAAHERLAPQLNEARRVLTQHFEVTKTTELDGVGMAVATRSQLDTDKVRAHLGDRVTEFTKTVTSRTLFVIEGA